MKITDIQELITALCKIYGRDWSGIARGVQANGYYTDMDIRTLADKIRKAKSYGALRHMNIKEPECPLEEDNEPFDAVARSRVSNREQTKLVMLEHMVDMTADKILEIAGFLPSEWRLTACNFKYWNVLYKTRTGKHKVNELFAASVTAAPREPTNT